MRAVQKIFSTKKKRKCELLESGRKKRQGIKLESGDKTSSRSNSGVAHENCGSKEFDKDYVRGLVKTLRGHYREICAICGSVCVRVSP